jgi:hypothetical protein
MIGHNLLVESCLFLVPAVVESRDLSTPAEHAPLTPLSITSLSRSLGQMTQTNGAVHIDLFKETLLFRTRTNRRLIRSPPFLSLHSRLVID